MIFSKRGSNRGAAKKKTLQEFREAAEQGDADAQYRLGMMYAKGKGAIQHDLEAVKWYRKAAEQGHAAAQYEMGHLYVYGRGVTEEFFQAYIWLNLAAAGGNRDAFVIRNIFGRAITAEQRAEAQQIAWEFKPRKEE